MFYKVIGKKCTNEKCGKNNEIVALHRTICEEPECGKELEFVRIPNWPVIIASLLVCFTVVAFLVGKNYFKNIQPQPVHEQKEKEVVQPETVVRDRLKDFVSKANDPNIVLTDNNKLVIKDKVFFDFDSYKIEPAGEDIVKRLAVVFRQLLDDEAIREKIESVEIQGYTDNKGSDDYNNKLSQNRADVVMQYILKAEPLLNTKYTNYFTAAGYGSKNPEKDNMTDEGRAYNRRMSVVVHIKK